MSGGGGSQQVTQSSEPPAYLQPYLTDVMREASRAYYGGAPSTTLRGGVPTGARTYRGGMGRGRGVAPVSTTTEGGQGPTFAPPEYFPGPTYVPYSPETEAALQLQTYRSLLGSPLTAGAQSELGRTISGDYLFGQPGFNAAYQAAANRIIPQVTSAFGGAGRLDSGLARTAMTQALGDVFAGQYGQERSRQLQAAGMAPQLAGLDYMDIAQLGQVGGAREAMGQQQLQDAMARWQFYQQRPYEMLSRYAGLVGGMPAMGGTTTQTVPQAGMGQKLLGGALGGAGLWQAFNPGTAATMGALGPWALGGAALMGLLS